MRRREVLKYVGGGAAVAATGCLSEGSGGPTNETDKGPENPSNTTDNDGNGTDNETNGTTVTDTSFSVVSRSRGGAEESASYRFENGMLRVRGTILGSDACKIAELGSAEYDEERGAVVVNVVTVNVEDANRRMCNEVITPIEYEASIEFEGEQPSVVVTHNGEEVEVERGEPDENKKEGDTTSLTGSEFEVTGSECGTETNKAKYTPSQGTSEGSASEGIVEGILWGPDACTTAELGYVSYNRSDDTLVADVRTTSTDDEACADCITEVSYRLVAEFENGVANAASVSHDGVRVDALERGGVESAEFAVEGIGSASGNEGKADAKFNEGERSITVNGTIIGNDGCKTARLAEAYVEDGALNVDVETVDTGGGMCTQALVAIEYTATLTFDGEIPNEVSVSHDGEGVMGAAYESSSASAGPGPSDD